MISHLAVGDLVRCDAEPDWGVGQIQSIIRDRVTVTFENAGKRVFVGETAVDSLEAADL